MLDKFKSNIDKNLPFLKEGKCLLTNSGGIDSVVLTHLCSALGYNISLAHCNFNLRGNESDDDEDFVLQLGESLNLEVFIQHFDTKSYARENKLSTQVAARNLRYGWFADLADQLKFDFILTAHHLDDNLETFLINFSRGTGLDGLTGIPEINGNIVRPLLPFSKEEIEVYGIQNNLKWRDDSTNASNNYMRNKLRHDVIPTLKNITPQLLNNFKNTTTYLQDIAVIVHDRMDRISDKVMRKIDNSTTAFDIKALLELKNPKPYIYQLFKNYNFSEWDDVYNLIYAQSGKAVYSPGYRLLKDRDSLLLSRIVTEVFNEKILINKASQIVKLPIGELDFSKNQESVQSSKNSIIIDYDELTFPLEVRTREEGDFFYPLGLGGKKKVSKFFKDEKLSRIQKDQTFILTSADKIVWIIGHRMDERFKVTERTSNILKIDFKPNH